jgi:2-dehydro-3-deoxygalactonokinase
MMIGVDWGTSRLRAFLLDGDGAVRATRASDAGIVTLDGGGFDAALAPLLHDWPAGLTLLLCGMIGSRQGVVEAPYVACPAGLPDLARALVPVRIAGRDGMIVPGLSCAPPDVLRGEETLIAGAGLSDALACLPGSHAKWVRVAEGAVQGFRTYLTGELFAAVAQHTIVGRLMQPEDPLDWQDFFDQGVAAARGDRAAPTALLFGARAAVLLGRLPARGLRPYVSGVLIGAELAAEVPRGRVVLIGGGELVARYARAFTTAGIAHEFGPPDAAPAGLFRIAAAAGLLP